MKKISLLLICFIAIFILNTNVSAWGASGSGGSASGVSGWNGKNGLVTDSNGDVIEGVRLTAYRYTGGASATKIGRSIDVLRTYAMYQAASATKQPYRVIVGGIALYSKFDYIMNDKIVKDQLDTYFSNSEYKSNNFLYYASQIGFTGFPKIYGVSNNNFRANFNSYLSVAANQAKLFSLMGISTVNCKDTYIVAEYIMEIHIGTTRYMGTAYELASFENAKDMSKTINWRLPWGLRVRKSDAKDNKNGFIDGFFKSIDSAVSTNARITAAGIRGKNGYNINVFWLYDKNCPSPTPTPTPTPTPPSGESCDINNPDHFTDKNKNGIPDDGPNGENCCEVFKDSIPRLAEEYPICGRCTTEDLNPRVDDANCDLNDNVATYSDGVTSIDNSTCLSYVSDEINEEVSNSSQYETLKINDYCSLVCVEQTSISLPTNPTTVFGYGHFVWPTSKENTIFPDNTLTVSGTKNCKILVKSKTLWKDKPVAADRNKIVNDCYYLGSAYNVSVSKILNLNPEIKLSYDINYDDKNIADVYENGKTNLQVDEESMACYKVDYDKNNPQYNKEGTAIDCNNNTTLLNILQFNGSILQPMNKIPIGNPDKGKADFEDYVAEIRSVRINITKTLKYKIPDGYNAYLSKATGIPITSAKELDLCKKNNNCLEVGYGNIPLAQFTNSLSLRNKYDGSVSISYSNIGTNGKYDNVINGDYTCTIKDKDKCDPDIEKCDCDPDIETCYTCPACDVYAGDNCGMDITDCVTDYIASKIDLSDDSNVTDEEIKKVEEEAVAHCQLIECPGSGRTVIYRVIDLDNPFPSISGTGRSAGINWAINDNVKKYIKENRGVETKTVYDLTPMYTFNLDAKTIRNIRDYNKGKDYDDFELKCNDDGRECISSTIREAGFGLDSTRSTCSSSSRNTFNKCQYES